MLLLIVKFVKQNKGVKMKNFYDNFLYYFSSGLDTPKLCLVKWIGDFASNSSCSRSRFNFRVTENLKVGKLGPQIDKKQTFAENCGDARRCLARYLAGKFTFDEFAYALATLRKNEN